MNEDESQSSVDPPWLDGIEGDEARALIESDAPVIRVVAGPGAGKTTCLKRRTQRLIEGVGVEPTAIFVGTFTRAIATDLRSSLGDAIKVSTLHSLAYQLLRENPAACMGMKLRFLLEYEEDAMLYDIATVVPELDNQRERKRALRRLQSARAERQDLPDAQFAGAVHRWLAAHGGMLIGEVVHLAVQGLESEDIPPGQFDHVVVDEYQDLTASEQELVERVWSRNGSLVILGDNDQSIYAFRFNHPDGVDEFAIRWKDEEIYDIPIGENRRCGDAIVGMANLMMAELGTTKPPMQPMSGRVGQLDVVQWDTIEAEIAGLATYVKSRPDESFLILVPRRFIGYRLQEAIGDDARTSFRQEVLEHQAAQERFAAASVVANPDDAVAVRSWLGFRGSIPEQAPERNASAYSSIPGGQHGVQLVRDIASGATVLSGTGALSMRRRAEQLVAWFDGGLPQELGEQIGFFFDPAIADAVEEDPERRRWLRADLETLRSAALQLAAEPDATLQKVIAALRYRIATRAPLIHEEDEPRVRIMTQHSAKGLEADNIILAGVADQLVPGLSTDSDELAEQARLLYVAVTRAKDKLVVSWPRAMRYADAMRYRVRRDKVRTVQGGLKINLLSRSRLLPQGLTGVVPGNQWLEDQGDD